jgi:predicted CXXCH cytochrome family protein
MRTVAGFVSGGKGFWRNARSRADAPATMRNNAKKGGGNHKWAKRPLAGSAIILFSLAVFAFAPRASAQRLIAAASGPTNSDCLACHGNPSFSIPLSDGETLSLYVNQKDFAHSVHSGLACTDCHSDITSIPHAARSFPNRRAVSLAYYQLCRQCHFEQYTRLLDGIHFDALSKGKTNAPTCVDCHGAHSITPPNQPRTRISDTCARCHAKVAKAYAGSVHGKALAQGNRDVPVCTDCHHAHDISNPLSSEWHLSIPQLCARCHSDAKIMRKYGISTDVLTTYLNDFHGMTASLERSEHVAPSQFTVTCTDCHGVHDIERVDSAGLLRIKGHLLTVCQRCHPGATSNFPSAWIGHYEPSPRHAPLVYAVKLFYAFFIPFTIIGLLLQILLHLWRVVVNR